MTWQVVARLTHLSEPAQRRLWRLLIAGCVFVLVLCWAGLSVLTHAAEKSFEEAGQTYVMAAPLAAEIMDLKGRRGQYESLPPLAAAESVVLDLGVGQGRVKLRPMELPAASDAIELSAPGVDLRELTSLLRDLRLKAGLRTLSVHIAAHVPDGRRADMELVLAR